MGADPNEEKNVAQRSWAPSCRKHLPSALPALACSTPSFLRSGGMIFTFYKAQGKSTGSSLVEADKVELAKELMEKAKVRFKLVHNALHYPNTLTKRQVFFPHIFCTGQGREFYSARRRRRGRQIC